MSRRPKRTRAAAPHDLQPPRKPASHAATAVCALLLAAVAIVFGQTVRHDFVNYDDNVYVYENVRVAEGLTAGGIGWALTTNHGSLWAPATWTSYLLDSQLYGPKPWGYHLTNVLLHAATAILLFLVLWRMTGDFWPGALAAAVFAVHPLRAEAVAWVAERKGLLSGLFFVLTLGAYLRYVRRPSAVRYLAIAILFALGLMAKPMLVTLPFVLLLLDYWPLGRMDEKPRQAVEPSGAGARRGFLGLLVEKIPLLLLSAAACAAAPLSQGRAVIKLENVAMSTRLANAPVSYVAYLGQFFCPVNLAIPYPHPGVDLPSWQPLATLSALLAVSAAAIVWRRRIPCLFVGWFWYVGMLVPVIGLVQVGLHAMADRYTYLPQIGLCVVLAWGGARLARTRPRRRLACGVASAIAVAALMGCTWRQTAFWRDSETLWRHTLACTSRNGLAHFNLGAALAAQGRSDEAVAEYQEALAIAPNDAEAHSNLGNALAGQGRIDDAITHYETALKLKPAYAEAHSNLGVALARLGRLDEATRHYQRAIDLDPDYAEAHCNLGNALARQARLDEAIAQYQWALRIRPGLADVRRNLGLVSSRREAIRKTLAGRQELLRSQPGDVALLSDTAWTLATNYSASLRDGAAAVELAGRAVRLSGGQDATALIALAAAYAETGRFPEAVQTARRALELARRQKNPPLAEAISAQLSLYEAGTPSRAP
jgi:protein O-mannosyl-transferase